MHNHACICLYKGRVSLEEFTRNETGCLLERKLVIVGRLFTMYFERIFNFGNILMFYLFKKLNLKATKIKCNVLLDPLSCAGLKWATP